MLPLQGEGTPIQGLPKEEGIQGHSLDSSSRAGEGNGVEDCGGKRVGHQGLDSPLVTKNNTGALSSSTGQSYKTSLVTKKYASSTAIYIPAFNVSSTTSKPVPSESNRYAALAKMSDSDSSTDETEISNAEQGAGLTTVSAASPHNPPEPLIWELPACEPLGGNTSAGLANQSAKPRKGKGSGKRPREVAMNEASVGMPQQVVP